MTGHFFIYSILKFFILTACKKTAFKNNSGKKLFKGSDYQNRDVLIKAELFYLWLCSEGYRNSHESSSKPQYWQVLQHSKT